MAGTTECLILYITIWNVILVVVYRHGCTPEDFHSVIAKVDIVI